MIKSIHGLRCMRAAACSFFSPTGRHQGPQVCYAGAAGAAGEQEFVRRPTERDVKRSKGTAATDKGNSKTRSPKPSALGTGAAKRSKAHAQGRAPGPRIQIQLLPSSVMQMEPPAAASALLIQNLVRLCSDLRLPVAYKVSEVASSSGDDAARTFFIIVHVLADNAFKKYLQHCSQSDLMLFRGLLLQVTTDAPVSRLLSAQVQQAFLPKFENEGQDASIASAITSAASERFMVVTIKHSGSLVTLSGAQGFAAKNSLDNEFTAGAALLLRAHFRRSTADADADARLAALMSELRRRRMAVSFEMVTGCHGHHGQLPAAEYLVATSAHAADSDTGRPVFLPWLDFTRFCLAHGLPVNDTWLVAGGRNAAAARDALDDLALRGGPTSAALRALSALVADGAADGCLHLPGAYPHDQWQGTRIEGFVVAQGQPVTSENTAALQELLPALRAAVLPLGLVEAALRRPYADILAQQASTAEAAAAAQENSMQVDQPASGGQAGAAGAVPAATTPQQRAQVQVRELCCDWLPQRELRPAGAELKARVVALLSGAPLLPAAGTGGEAAGAAEVTLRLPLGGQVLYSRAGLAACPPEALLAQLAPDLQGRPDAPELAKLLGQVAHHGAAAEAAATEAARAAAAAERAAGALAAAEAAAGAGAEAEAVAAARAEAKAAADAASAAAAAEAEPASKRKVAMVQLLRALAGAPDVGATLRYKKKMTMWSYGGAEGADGEPVVGYCMMTFVIRNGLRALALGRQTYLNYVASLVKNWGLPRRAEADVHAFARAWAAWVEAGGRPGAGAGTALKVSDASYLDAAEPFVAELLRSRGALLEAANQGAPARPPGAFQGVVVLLDTPRATAEALQARLHALHLLDGSAAGNGAGAAAALPPFSRDLVSQGAVLWLPEGGGVPKALKPLADAAAPHLFVAVQRPAPVAGPDGAPAAKRQAGMQTTKLKLLEPALRTVKLAPGAAPRLKYLAAASASVSAADEAAAQAAAATAAAVDALQAWLGAGAPLPAQDPSVICCFITMPGTGKTVLTAGLEARLRSVSGVGEAGAAAMDCDAAEGASGSNGAGPSALQLKVLNSDTMKTTIKNFKPNRYWPEVADAAVTCVGGGSATLVIADKNLVPSPRGNIQRVLGQLKSSSSTTVAVLPYCSGPSSQALLPHLYQGLPELPVPLEFIALCMLRVLARKQHEGALDEDCNEAMSVVAMFATFYRHTSWDKLLLEARSAFSSVLELPIMRGLGASAQPPAAGTSLGPGGDSVDSVTAAPPPVAVHPHVEELLRHVAEGVSNVSLDAKPPLPAAWEARARVLLREPEVAAALTALQRPLADLQADVAEALSKALSAKKEDPAAAAAAAANDTLEPLQSEPSLSTAMRAQLTTDPGLASSSSAAAAPGTGKPVRWMGIAGLSVAPLLEAAQALPLPAGVAARVAAGRPEYHVTLWHVDDAGRSGGDEGLRGALAASVGQEALLEVLAVDCCEDVTAAQVQLLSVPDEAIVHRGYAHITLAVGPKAQPKDANTLPDRIKAGTAQRFALPEPIQLTGQILAFTEG